MKSILYCGTPTGIPDFEFGSGCPCFPITFEFVYGAGTGEDGNEGEEFVCALRLRIFAFNFVISYRGMPPAFSVPDAGGLLNVDVSSLSPFPTLGEAASTSSQFRIGQAGHPWPSASQIWQICSILQSLPLVHFPSPKRKQMGLPLDLLLRATPPGS